MGLLDIKAPGGARRAPRIAVGAREGVSEGDRPEKASLPAYGPPRASSQGLLSVEEPRGELQADRVAEACPSVEITDPSRAGLVEWEEDEPFVHYCQCGAWGVYGYGVDLLAGRLGRWYCRAHRPEGGR